MDTSKMNIEQAKALLDRDDLNKVKRVAEKGGTLAQPDRRKLRRFIKLADAQKRAAEKEQTITIDPKTFEGSFEQNRRRRKVFELRMRRYSMRDMAAELGVSLGAIVRDVKHIEAALQSHLLDSAQATKIINEKLMNLEAVQEMAMDALKDAEGNERNGYLNTIIKATEVQTALMQDAGLLPKAGRKVELTGKDGVPLQTMALTPTIHVTIETTEETSRIASQFNGTN